MQRVSLIHGTSPFLFVAPHGYKADDFNTDIIVERLASTLNGSAIINHGWQKSEVVDINASKANCNDLTHMVDVVQDEFLLPLLRKVNNLKKFHQTVFVFFIHGVSNNVRKLAKDPNLEIILGYGEGWPKSSYTCGINMKNFIMHELDKHGICCYQGKPDGKYSAFSKNNLTQYWRKTRFDPSVDAIQFEIVKELREDRTISLLTADYVAESIRYVYSNRNFLPPSSKIYNRLI